MCVGGGGGVGCGGGIIFYDHKIGHTQYSIISKNNSIEANRKSHSGRT